MTALDIKNAILAGKTVHWATSSYVVIHDEIGQWLIKCLVNDSCIGLTWRDGVTLNGKESEFYIAGEKKV
jgi:hypothetical protein